MDTVSENQNTNEDLNSINRRIKKLADDSENLLKQLINENHELKKELLQAQYQYRLLDALMSNIVKTTEERLNQVKSAKLLNEETSEIHE